MTCFIYFSFQFGIHLWRTWMRWNYFSEGNKLHQRRNIDFTVYGRVSRSEYGTKSQSKVRFSVHGSVHLKYIPIYIYIYIYIQQKDATLHNLFISVNCPTCFGWYLHPSSGAHNCIYSIWHLSVKPLLLPAAIVEELELRFPTLPR